MLGSRDYDTYSPPESHTPRILADHVPKEKAVRDFVVDGAEKNIQEIVSKLKFISKIQPGQKINVSVMSPSKLGVLPWLYRKFWLVEDSASTQCFLDTIFHEAFQTSENYLKRDDPFYREMGTIIREALKESKLGLKALAKTYEKDVMFVSKIETVESTLDAKLRLLNQI